MQSLRLVDGDIVFDNGDLELVDDLEELAQCCMVATGTNRGEWFLNPEMGITFSTFLGKRINEEEMRDEITQGLMQEDRIQSVDEVIFEPDLKSRTMVVSFAATGVDGQAIKDRREINA